MVKTLRAKGWLLEEQINHAAANVAAHQLYVALSHSKTSSLEAGLVVLKERIKEIEAELTRRGGVDG